MVQTKAAKNHKKKKTTLYRERSHEDRQKFIEKIAKVDYSSIVYIDEAGVAISGIWKSFARRENLCLVKNERISMIGGWIQKKFIAPMTFTGECDKDVFNAWLEQILLPELPAGTTIVMDNAAFHKTAKTRELIEGAGCHLLYLPAYSPDPNPIEHCWHTIKSWSDLACINKITSSFLLVRLLLRFII